MQFRFTGVNIDINFGKLDRRDVNNSGTPWILTSFLLRLIRYYLAYLVFVHKISPVPYFQFCDIFHCNKNKFQFFI